MKTHAHDPRFTEILRYMNIGRSARDSTLTPADGALVFCREDPGMALAAGTLYERKLIKYIVLTGGIGVDSGEGSRAAGSEAAHQQRLLVEAHGIPKEGVLYLETLAKNGGQNSRFGIDTIRNNQLPHENIILLLYPDKARRVYAAHTYIAREEKSFHAANQVVCMDATIDLESPVNQKILLEELLRVADWPTKNWADPQPDLPTNLVSWAREVLPTL